MSQTGRIEISVRLVFCCLARGWKMAGYQNEDEIAAVVNGFESCATAKEDFKHRSHLTVAVWYLLHSTPNEALEKMRSGLFRFLEHHDVGREKYHETLTVFWIQLVQKAITEVGPGSLVRDDK